ncbi:hypothetical protein MTO96_041885 [Rhipicephalus appendiculatus]
MASCVLEEVLVHIERVSAQDRQCLDEENVAWIPRLGFLPPTMAFREIRRVLNASYTVSLRLERVAWLYCWLLPRRKIRPWLLFRFGASALHADCPTLLKALAKALQSGRPALDAQCEALLRDVLRLPDQQVPGSELAGTRGHVPGALERPALRGGVRRDERRTAKARDRHPRRPSRGERRTASGPPRRPGRRVLCGSPRRRWCALISIREKPKYCGAALRAT